MSLFLVALLIILLFIAALFRLSILVALDLELGFSGEDIAAPDTMPSSEHRKERKPRA